MPIVVSTNKFQVNFKVEFPDGSSTCVFWINSCFLVDTNTLHDRIKTEIKINGKKFKFVECKEDTLDTIIKLIDWSHTLCTKIKLKDVDDLYESYQNIFEFDSGLNLDDITDIYMEYAPEKFRNYLIDNAFVNLKDSYVCPEKSGVEHSYQNSYPMNGWEVSRKPDNYGHECGTAIEINWVTKKITQIGFSTDD
jgi:hypothetical protein